MYVALNNAKAQLTGAVAIGATSLPITVGKSSLFAVGANYSYVVLQSASTYEVVKLTGISGDNLTVNATTKAWAIGDVVECRPCAEAMADFGVAEQVYGSSAVSIADSDQIGFVDASASNALAKITWANIKATLKTYFDSLYRAVTGDVSLAAGAAVVFEGTTDDANETTLTATDPTADRSITLPDQSGIVMVMANGADIASASTINLTAATGDMSDVTGSTAITAVTLAEGTEKAVRFTGTLTLTNGASLILPGASNITTADGDIAVFRGYALGVVRCIDYQRASGLPIVASASITMGTKQAGSGTTENAFTSLPAGIKRLSLNFTSLSTNGASLIIVQLGDSGGYKASGYSGAIETASSRYTLSDGFKLVGTGAASWAMHGRLVLELMDASTYLWSATIFSADSAGGAVYLGAGSVTLSGALDRLRVTTQGGSDTIDVASEFNITYE